MTRPWGPKNRIHVFWYRLFHFFQDWSEYPTKGAYVTEPTQDFGRARCWISSSRNNTVVISVDASDGWPDEQCFINADEARKFAAHLIAFADESERQTS